MIFNQLFDAINIGLVILDRDLKIHKWNRWMEIHSGITENELKDTLIFDAFPKLKSRKFQRSCKSVFAFGNFCFFSQKLHSYMFPFKSTAYFDTSFEYMQQSCTMGPLRDENNVVQYLFIYIQDVTEVAVFEQKLVEMNTKDGLTGLYNRRFMDEKLKEEFFRCKRYPSEFSMIMLDIDFFKKVNDTYGHQCGDYILKSVSARVASLIRNIDFLFRYGGEEFCCMLPATGNEGALIVAERFRKAIMDLENNYDGSVIKVTISLGVSAVTENITKPEMLLQKADDALYKAKREGRNRVEEMD